MTTNNKITLLVMLTLILCTKSIVGLAQDYDSTSDSQADLNQALMTCAACHGKAGISPNTQWPNLAGQKAEYLYQQLLSYKSGERKNELMQASLLSAYTNAQLRSMAAYYAQIPKAAKTFDNGFDLPGAHVRAYCVSCHGMTGESVTDLWPNLSGQQAGYLAKQLNDYKSGAREHPIMQVIGNELTDQQILDVSEFYSTQ